MSQPALAPLPFELVYSDGEPLETRWHVLQMTLLFDVIGRVMAERGKSDFCVGGNMFVYYSRQQAEDVARGKQYFRGPDVFWVDGVDARRKRKAWVAWEEGGRLPDVIVELLSPTTATIDRTVKKDLYAQTFHTAEYYLYDPETRELEGFQLAGRSYRPKRPDKAATALERTARSVPRPLARHHHGRGGRLGPVVPLRREPGANCGRAGRGRAAAGRGGGSRGGASAGLLEKRGQ